MSTQSPTVRMLSLVCTLFIKLSLAAQAPFITTWKTDNPGISNSTSITIPTFPGGTYLYDVDWDNDGVYDQLGITGSVTHDYGVADTVTIRIQGLFPRIYFNNGGDRKKLLSIDQWGTNPWTSMEGAFMGCWNMHIPAADNPDLSGVTSMARMFQRCDVMNDDIGDWDVSQVTDMTDLFYRAFAFNQDISAWNVSGVTSMFQMFREAYAFNQPIGSWDVSNVTNMFAMFYSALSFDQDLSNWNVSQVTNMSVMFSGVTLSIDNYDTLLVSWATQSLQDAINFDGGNSQYCNGAFARQSIINNFNWNISDGGVEPTCEILVHFVTTWKTNNPGTSNNTSITIPTNGAGYQYDVDWNNDGVFDQIGVTGNVTHDYGVSGTYTIRIRGAFPQIYFAGAGDKDKILSVDQWGTIAWTSMNRAFQGCTNLSIPAGDVPDLSNVTDMSLMFQNATSFNSPIGNWDVSHVTNMSNMFQGATSFNSPIDGWVVDSVTNMLRIFSGATAFNQPLNSWNTSNVTIIWASFQNATSFNQPLSNWDVSGAPTLQFMFMGCSSFNQDISGWDVSNKTTLTSMFNGATSFNQDISGWNVSNTNNMSNMFNGAVAFDQNLAGWDMEGVTSVSGMFAGVTLSQENYDSLLIGWSQQNLTNNLTFDAGSSQYCPGAVGRQYMIDHFGWTISDGGIACEPSDYFVTTWKTDNPGTSDNNSITIPTTGSGYAYDVDWNNDGVFEELGLTGSVTHDYGMPDTVTIRIRGAFPRIFFSFGGDAEKLISIDQWGANRWSSQEYAFGGCANLQVTSSDIPDLSGLTSLQGMFAGCTSFNTDISAWDVSHVTNMVEVFSGSGFNQDINNWDVSLVTEMASMFSENAVFNQPLNNWDVSNVANMYNMFGSAVAFNQDISGWDVSNVTSMQSMFSFASSFDQDISGWDVGNVTDMSFMFSNNPGFNQPIGQWNTAQVMDMSRMFQNATSFNQPIYQWDVSNVLSMNEMFNGDSLSTSYYDSLLLYWSQLALQDNVVFHAGNSLYCAGLVGRFMLESEFGWSITDGGEDPSCGMQDFVTTWRTGDPMSGSNVIEIPTYPGETYNYAVDWDNDGIFDTIGITGDFYRDFGIDDTVSVRIRGIFPRIYCNDSPYADKLLSVDQWGSNPWTSMASAFTGCDNLQITAPDVPDLSGVTDLSAMFSKATHFNSDISAWDVSTVTDISSTFLSASAFNQPLDTWDVSKVTNMSTIFFDASSFNQPIGGWDVSKVTNMEGMFHSASAFNQPIGGWNPDSVTTMYEMFYGASSFNQDIGAWNVSQVADMGSMFQEAASFNQDISAWDVSQVTNMQDMFHDATAFDQPLGTWDVSKVNNMRNMFRNAQIFNQDIGTWEVGLVTNMEGMFQEAFAFNQDISTWNVANVTTMESMFAGGIFNQDIGAWDVSAVTSLSGMFFNNYDFNQDIGSWNVGNVTDMSYLFTASLQFDQDISGWNTHNVTNMRGMFYGAFGFSQFIGSWDVTNVEFFDSMFEQDTLTLEQYDDLLIGWGAQDLMPNRVFGGGFSQYCAGEAARQHLIDDLGWTITDGGRMCETSWTGNVSSDWFDPQNWSDGVPTSQFTVLIPDVGPNPYPVIDMPGATCSEIYIFPGTSVIISTSGVLQVLGE